ncbi:neuroendocrine protein 7B2-like isoform X2 [Ruditapes philippinarum]|uniref:neuroendocrine protein 7B2-like isoform X2 n=1 Tax=Ruditapes philippinarum TaxID=129788 RepID=UPI00295B47F3|nr:neuroendocrine protein 7B2-like isoform X2 [Ruditapes philippinarum]
MTNKSVIVTFIDFRCNSICPPSARASWRCSGVESISGFTMVILSPFLPVTYSVADILDKLGTGREINRHLFRKAKKIDIMNSFHVLGFATLIYAVQASGYADLLADLYMYNLDNPYNDKMATDWDVVYPDTLSDPKEPRDYGETALRDQEYMKQLPISGYQFISGGTGRQEDPSEVKTDKVLPAYCTPPNPCPFGYTGEDNCVKDFENTPEKNRKILEEQDCPCDAEHMLSCPPGKKTIDPKSGFVSDGLGTGDNTDLDALDSLGSMENIDLDSPERIGDIFPFNFEETIENPYLYGQKKSVAAKKQAPDHMIK